MLRLHAQICLDQLLDHTLTQCGTDDIPNTSVNQLSESAVKLHMNSVCNVCVRGTTHVNMVCCDLETL